MNEELTMRKIRAILSADAKGYSRLMRSDEEATVRTLNKYRAVITEFVQKYQGRVVDSPGDNILAEFSSVVHAVQCGFDIQESLRAENDKLPEKRRMQFRIGINLGDVIQDGDRIYGDGVNVAARMESLAEAGDICVSGSAYDQIEHKFPFGCEYLGEQSVKNITTPIRVYRLTRDESVNGCIVRPQAKKSSKRLIVAGVFGLLIFLVGGYLSWSLYHPHATASIEAASIDQMSLPLPDKPSIAVLPLKNLSEDEKDPDWSRPIGGLSWTYWYEARLGWVADPDKWLRKSLELAEKAVALGPDEPGGYQMLGMLALSRRDYEQAIDYREKVLALAPNDYIALMGLGSIL